MKAKRMLSVLAAAGVGVMIAACGSREASDAEITKDTAVLAASVQEQNKPAGDTQYPVTIDNFNMQTVYEAAPERIVSLSYSETEILTALGLQDKIVGIAEADNSVEVVSEEYRDAVSKLNIIAATDEGGVPSLETVLQQTPDFIYGTSFSFNPNYGVGTVEDFQKNEIRVYASATSYKENSTIEDTYQDILNLGKIFDVEEKAQKIVADMKAEVADIAEMTAGKEPIRFFIYDSGTAAPNTYAEDSYESSVIELAGGENVISKEGFEAGSIGWEVLIKENPDFIIINDWRGGEGAASIEEKIEFLKSMPELAEVEAIKNEHFISVPLDQVFLGNLQNIKAARMIADAFYSRQ